MHYALVRYHCRTCSPPIYRAQVHSHVSSRENSDSSDGQTADSVISVVTNIYSLLLSQGQQRACMQLQLSWLEQGRSNKGKTLTEFYSQMHTGVRKTRSSDLPYNSSVLRLHALRGMHVPEYCIAAWQIGRACLTDFGCLYLPLLDRPCFDRPIGRLIRRLSKE